MTKPTFLIAAPKSNSGKTLITLGLIKAISDQGYCVQPFKCGPDYIDPMHHTAIAGRASYNLDLWMSSESHLKSVFYTQMKNAEVGVVEGVMGLFDGARKDEGSSAAIARLLDIPVVLVVDASSVAYSVAPLLYGFKHFDRSIRLLGVIFNKVAGASHYQFLKEAAEDSGVKALGYVPRDKALAIDDRHLGLQMPGESKEADIMKRAAELIQKHVGLSELLESDRKVQWNCTKSHEIQVFCHSERSEASLCQQSSLPQSAPNNKGGDFGEAPFESQNLKIAIAADKAFNFTYQANLECLKALGTLGHFSPIADENVPDADLIWLPGGYPELFSGELSKNRLMLSAIRKFAESGKAIVAECGGMMYLGKEIILKDGSSFPMAGVFDFSTSFKDMKLHLGYREVSGESFVLRGHEFHYSELINAHSTPRYSVKTARGKEVEMPVFRHKGVWASYMHLYLGEPEQMKRFLKIVLGD
ncbi:cobyrinate a,c-diamide synthase [Marinilabilia salmonicolor]|uniref:cobyrinate a,c-diamide synthase n=1 Tax=Marinilabilia salmonicolor TaxID=989 RepID=UPI00029A9DE5|nr:cobyrinate a,c-diamide synthase [Marinilabilia salmonicolor]